MGFSRPYFSLSGINEAFLVLKMQKYKSFTKSIFWNLLWWQVFQGTNSQFALHKLQTIFYKLQSGFAKFSKFCGANIFENIHFWVLENKATLINSNFMQHSFIFHIIWWGHRNMELSIHIVWTLSKHFCWGLIKFLWPNTCSQGSREVQ